MIRKEELLKPKIQFLKLLLVPILAIFSFTLYVFLTGYRGRFQQADIPTVIQLDLSWKWIICLIILFAAFVYALIKLILANVNEFDKNISISGNTIMIDASDYTMKLKINNADRVKFRSSKIWTRIFFQEFYRIGIIRITYDGDRYSFFFPVKNQDLETKLKKKFNVKVS